MLHYFIRAIFHKKTKKWSIFFMISVVPYHFPCPAAYLDLLAYFMAREWLTKSQKINKNHKNEENAEKVPKRDKNQIMKIRWWVKIPQLAIPSISMNRPIASAENVVKGKQFLLGVLERFFFPCQMQQHAKWKQNKFFWKTAVSKFDTTLRRSVDTTDNSYLPSIDFLSPLYQIDAKRTNAFSR